MTSLAILLGDWIDDIETKPRRHPLLRNGERAPIPNIVRFSIYRRDGFRCRECGNGGEDMGAWLELDHALPWSAGGGDHSANLRVLCGPCNQRRSNWDDGAHLWSIRPTTWWCWWCWRAPELDDEPEDYDEPSRQRVARPAWKSGVNLNAAPFVTAHAEQVFCAWCYGYSYSDVWFSPDQQDRLAALCETRGAA